MSASEWLLTICGSLAVVGLAALVTIAWKSRETLVSLGTEFIGFKDEVRREFSRVRENIQNAIDRNGLSEYKTWRDRIDQKMIDHERRIVLIEHEWTKP